MSFRLSFVSFVLFLTFVAQAPAASIRRSALTLSATQGECAAPRPAKSFPAAARSVSIWFEASNVKAGDRVRADWYSPDGNFYTSNQWTELPPAASLCLLASLPVGGYGPAYLPGGWKVKIVWNDDTLLSLPFQITPGASSNGLVISSLSRSRVPAGETDLTLYGSGFQQDSQVVVEQLANAAGFRRFAVLTPRLKSSGEMDIHLKIPEPAEYQIIVQNPGGRISQSRALVVGFRGYRLPLTVGERWELTQGNVGRFSHDGNTLYAYDFAPRAGRCVTAMRGGTVYAYDGGLGQTPRIRSFGNYITIDHGDGQYSHYAHLQTGTFVVSTGQRVEAGQALAQIGTSGFSFGVHLHVQVTRAPRIASQSVPFLFEDVAGHDPAGPPPGQPVVRPNQLITSTFQSPLCDCGTRVFSTLANAPARTLPIAKAFNVTRPMGELQWWSDLVKIPANTQQMQVTLGWEGGSYLDLHLMSPSGKHYGWSGIKEGFSGEFTRPQGVTVPRPEPGTWRIAVQARTAALGTPPFEVLLMLRR